MKSNLYNGGSEWQNDYNNLPDYYQTWYRNYDAALGRWIAVDPVAESAQSMTSYQYAGNNPVMMNDPLGDKLDPAKMSHPIEDAPVNSFSYHGSAIDGDVDIRGGSPEDGVYGTDPALAYFLAMSNSTSLYHAGDGTDNDPKTGSRSFALETAREAASGQINLSGSGSVTAGYTWTVGPIPSGEVGVMAAKRWYLSVDGGDVDQGRQIQLTRGGIKGGVLDATFFVSGTPASGLQMIQIASYSQNGSTYNHVDGGFNGKPYYYTPKQIQSKDFLIWNNSTGEIRVYDRPGDGDVNLVRFETLIVAVNFNNSGADKILGAFQWIWTPSANYPITLSSTASPTAVGIIQRTYPWYKFK